jgi:hypothetical protein
MWGCIDSAVVKIDNNICPSHPILSFRVNEIGPYLRPNYFLGTKQMSNSAKPKRHAPTAKKKVGAKPRTKKSGDLVTAYKKYFVAPPTTPDAFHIFDLTTDGSSISYSSHT